MAIVFNESASKLIKIPFPGCLLLATKDEFKKMLLRGKWFKRAESTAKRNKNEGEDK